MTPPMHAEHFGDRRVPSRRMCVGLLCAILMGIAGSLASAAEDAPSASGVILTIHGQLTDVTVKTVKRRIEQARDMGASVIVFELDTPGGLVSSSIEIADAIKNLTGIRTVAWVNPNAHSGGAIVAVACDEIVMARSSRIGDSQVIMGGPTGVGAVPEELKPKANTPVLAEFRASARLNGYDQKLCEAFVLPEREVWWIEHIETGKRRFVFRDEKLRLLGETETAREESETNEADEEKAKEKPSVKNTIAANKGEVEWKLVETYRDPLLDMDVDAIQPVVRDDQLLEMSAGEARAYGFSKGIVVHNEDLRSRYNLTELTRLAPSWSEALAYWMTSIYVRGFLMLIVLLGAYVEFHTPGVGVPGLVALVCLAIFVGAPYLTGLANVWEVVFIVLGVVLMAIEVFVIPGFGMAGISGIMLLAVGLLATFVPDEPGRSFPLYIPQLASTWEGLKIALYTLVTSLAASLIGIVALSRFLPQMPMFRRIVPANPTPSEVMVDDPYRGAARVGDVGVSEGSLHPAGKARFASVLVDVVTQGEYLDANARVEVIERRGNRVVVRATA